MAKQKIVRCVSDWSALEQHTVKGARAVEVREYFYNGETWLKLAVDGAIFESPAIFWERES